ncbi:hypothetical protein [Pseudalkalibacillus decolorationis]|uniref:hypothetical protein n=1 Tax=Pseudalkalibacillus decolorationis TaxID=163879 RepID=UPI0021490B44|nr:hypothetical protein [Pseudalkalibacillus decolorationis]
MTTKQLFNQLDNIWYHYKPHILVGIFIVVALIPLVFSSNDQRESALDVAIMGNVVDEQKQQNLQSKATSAILENDSDSEVKLNFWPVTGNLSAPQNHTLNQKLLTQIATKDIDILIMNMEDFLYYAQQGTFLRLDNHNKLSKLLQNKNVRPVSLKSADEGEEHILGVEINGNSLFEDAGFVTENKVLGIVSNAEHKETTSQFVKWLINS